MIYNMYDHSTWSLRTVAQTIILCFCRGQISSMRMQGHVWPSFKWSVFGQDIHHQRVVPRGLAPTIIHLGNRPFTEDFVTLSLSFFPFKLNLTFLTQ